jgi:hypothetical protein
VVVIGGSPHGLLMIETKDPVGKTDSPQLLQDSSVTSAKVGHSALKIWQYRNRLKCPVRNQNVLVILMPELK